MYPITCDTAYFGGIAIICAHDPASGAPLRSGSPSGPQIAPQMPIQRLRRHFGMNTTWYLHSCWAGIETASRSEEHTSELQSRLHLVCRLLLEKKKNTMRSSMLDFSSLSCAPRTSSWRC